MRTSPPHSWSSRCGVADVPRVGDDETPRPAGPHVPPKQRLTAGELDDRFEVITLLTARVGFQDDLDVPALVRLAADQGLLADGPSADRISYFVSSHAVVRTNAAGMSRWRKRLFLALWRNAASPIAYFRLPSDQTVIVGEEIEV